MPHPKMKIFKQNLLLIFFYFFHTQNHWNILGKLKINFCHWRGVKKNLKVPMPRPKMKIFKKKIFQNFFLFFSHPKPLKHLRKVENKFLPFFWRGVKKPKSAYATAENENFQKKILLIFFLFFPHPKPKTSLESWK